MHPHLAQLPIACLLLLLPVNTRLLGAITIQVWKYFSKFSQDALWTKVLV